MTDIGGVGLLPFQDPSSSSSSFTGVRPGPGDSRARELERPLKPEISNDPSSAYWPYYWVHTVVPRYWAYFIRH